MSSHDEIPEDIRKQIKDFETKLNNLSHLKGGARDQAVLKCEKHLKRIHRLIGTYQSSIESGIFEDNVATHKSQLKQFQQTQKQFQRDLDSNKEDNGTQDDLFKHKDKASKNIGAQKGGNNRQMVIEEGNRAQKQSEDALKRALVGVHKMDEQANEILTELDRQINVLDQIYDDMNDTETTLKRAQKHLKYFARQVYTDRCLIFVIVVIALAIIVIIALAIAGKTPQQTSSQVA